MFRDTTQRGLVCYLLCRWIPGSPWCLEPDGYRPTGPKPVGKSTGEQAMLRFARALWRGDTLPVWLGWDRTRMNDVATLLVAMNTGKIEHWILERTT